MVREFQAVLDGLPGKPPAPLEEYRELICEMRRRGLTYREIAGVLAERLQVKADLGQIYDVLRGSTARKRTVRVRQRAEADAAPAVSETARPVQPRQAPPPRSLAPTRQAPKPEVPAVRMMPAVAPPVRRPLAKPEEKAVFEWDESEPLRLTGDSKKNE